MKIIKWKKIKSEIALTANIFRYVKIKSESPTSGKIGDFDVLQCSNWVNIMALTKDKKIVLIKQYRHGIEDVTLEIPGGAVNLNEDPKEAAMRELKEETGYTSKNWQHIGRVAANPAFMNNYCDTFLARDATLTHKQELDPFEEIEVFLTDESELKRLVKNKEINHSIVISAFYLFLGASEA